MRVYTVYMVFINTLSCCKEIMKRPICSPVLKNVYDIKTADHLVIGVGLWQGPKTPEGTLRAKNSYVRNIIMLLDAITNPIKFI